MKKLPKQNMGLGDLGSGSLIFVQKFRFIVKSQHLNEYITKSCNFDLVNKTINIFGYELCMLKGEKDIPIITWAEGMQKEKWPLLGEEQIGFGVKVGF